MHWGFQNRIGVLIFPADRDYYLQYFGFDIEADKRPLKDGAFQYRAEFALKNDPGLDSTGVKINAIVEVAQVGLVHNRIGFRRNRKWSFVECTHTIVYSTQLPSALTFAEDLEMQEGALSETNEKIVAKAGGPIALSPQDHFTALKSYVAAIAETGLGKMLSATQGSDEELPFGFNGEMQSQVINALRDVAPTATNALIQNFFLELVENTPRDWVRSRLALLHDRFDLRSAIATDPLVFKELLSKFEPDLLFGMVLTGEQIDPRIVDVGIHSDAQEVVRIGARVSTDTALDWVDAHHDFMLLISNEGFTPYSDMPVFWEGEDSYGIGDEVTISRSHFHSEFPDESWTILKQTSFTEDDSRREPSQEEDLLEFWEELGVVVRILVTDPNPIEEKLASINELYDLEFSLFQAPLAFSVVDKALKAPKLQAMAADFEDTDLDIVTAIADSNDVGILTLLFRNPRTKDLVINKLRNFKATADEMLLYCGRTLRASEALALSELQLACHSKILRLKNEQDPRLDEPDPEIIIEKGSVTSINLEESGLEFLPNSIGAFSELVLLNLAKNRLKWLPYGIGKMTHLKKLDAHENQLRRLPSSIGNLVALDKFTLYDNHIRQLPQSFGNLQSLKELSLHGNLLDHLPASIGNMLCLARIYLTDNKLQALPPIIGNLKNISEIAIAIASNGLKELPENIGNLQDLRELYLSDNKLESLPESFQELKSLTKLDLEDNLIKDFPLALSNLTSLVALRISGNACRTFPEFILKLTKLHSLSFGGNDIHSLPSEFSNLTELNWLKITDSPITMISQEVSKLTKLDYFIFEGSDTTVFPDSIGKLKKETRPHLIEKNKAFYQTELIHHRK